MKFPRMELKAFFLPALLVALYYHFSFQEWPASLTIVSYRNDQLGFVGNGPIQGSEGTFVARLCNGSLLSWGEAVDPRAHTLKNVKAVFANKKAFAAILEDDTVQTWGDPGFGGDSSAVAMKLHHVKGICATRLAFAALKADGTVVTWGDKGDGGDSSSVSSQLVGVKAVYSTELAFAAVLHDGTMVTWGHSMYGGKIDRQLTQVESIAGSRQTFAALLKDGTVRTWGGSTVSPPNGLDGVKAICASSEAFAALKIDGTVVTWGSPLYGGNSSSVSGSLQQVDAISATAVAFAARRRDGKIVTWGFPGHGQEDHITAGGEVKEIHATLYAFAALRKDGTVFTWGHKDFGGRSTQVQNDLTQVESISATNQAFAARRKDGSVVAWGNRDLGGSSVPQLRQAGATCGFKEPTVSLGQLSLIVTLLVGVWVAWVTWQHKNEAIARSFTLPSFPSLPSFPLPSLLPSLPSLFSLPSALCSFFLKRCPNRRKGPASYPSGTKNPFEPPLSSLPAGCAAARSTADPSQWVAVLTVQDGPFEGGLFELSLKLPADFPSSRPLVKFVPPITHPNVDSQTGEVTVPWSGDMNMGQALEAVRGLLVCPKVNNPQVEVRNPEAKKAWENNALEYDAQAHQEARKSWLAILRPRDAANLVCDLLLPAKKVTRAAQHELFRIVGSKEIEQHVNATVYGPVEDDEKRRLEERQKHCQVEQDRAGLNLQLVTTLRSLSELRDPQVVVVLEGLERKLAGLYVAEAQTPETVDDFSHTTRPPETKSTECFKLLVAEAERETARLGGLMKNCMQKYELLYSRFEKVKQIKSFTVSPTEKIRQPLAGDARLLLTQAKQLESLLRREFRDLVDTFNSPSNEEGRGLAEAKEATTTTATTTAASGEMERADETSGEEAKTMALIKDSKLCLSSGLRVQAKFGPMKSLTRLQHKGAPHTVLDYARVMVIFADPLLLALFYDELAKRFDVLQVKNKFLVKEVTEPPNVHINIAFGGHVCEVQLTLEDFALIKDFSHKPYEILRIAQDQSGALKQNPHELVEAMQHIMAQGVYWTHPGAATYPSLPNAGIY